MLAFSSRTGGLDMNLISRNERAPLIVLVSLLGLSVTGLFPMSASAADGEEGYYKFTAPQAESEDLAIRKSSLIPQPLRIGGIRIQNGILGPSDGGNASITYTMPEPGFVTIRVLKRGTRELYLATIVNFEYRDAGRQTEIWDGRNFYGERLDASKTPFTYRIRAESANAAPPPPGYKQIEYEPGQTQQELIQVTNFERHIHTWHENKYENVPLLTISKPKPEQVLTGMVVVKSGVDKERRGFGDKYGYGVRYYVDNDIIHEEFYTPESGGNFYYELDTTAYEDGKHLLYVGMCDHNEHVTSHGIEVVIDNRRK